MLKGLSAVWRFELTRYKAAPSAYLFVALMVAASAVATFFIGGFYGSNQTSLDLFFRYIPWVFVFFAPALVMGAWAEDIRRGTSEVLYSLPLSLASVHLGKFFAAWTVLALMLLATWMMPLTVMFLGTPDVGAMAAGYVGAFLLGGVILAVGLWASTMARTQSGAYALALVTAFLLCAMGWGLMTSLLQPILPEAALAALVDKGLLARFELMTRGLIALPDVTFMACLSVFFLLLGYVRLAVYQRMQVRRNLLVIPMIAGLLGLYTLSTWLPVQLDMTEDKYHTLSEGTYSLLKKMPENGATLKFYYSSGAHLDVSPNIRRFVTSMRDFLRTLQAADDRLRVVEIAPEDNVNDQLEMEERELVQLPLPNGEGVYLGMVLTSGGEETVIPLFDIKSPEQIEYQVMSALAEVVYGKARKKISIITELDLGDARQRPRIMLDMAQHYDVSLMRMGVPEIPEGTDLAIVFFAPFMEQETVYALDQFVMNGGNALIMLDPFLRTSVQDYHLMLDRHAEDEAVDHAADLLRKWGAHYDYRYLVVDNALASVVQHEDMSGTAAYPLWLTLSQNNMTGNTPVTTYIDRLTLPESGFFTPVKGVSSTYAPVLVSSKQSQVVSRTAFRDVDGPMLASLAEGEEKVRDLAVLLNGPFNSAFAGPPLRVRNWYADYGVPVPQHKSVTHQPGRVFALADVDFAADLFATTPQGNKVTPTSNYYFVRNIVEYLVGDGDLLSIRGRASHIRPFVMVTRLAQNTVATFGKEEQDLLARQFEVLEDIQELEHLIAQDSPRVGPSAREDIRVLKVEELKIRQQLKFIRRQGRDAVEQLGRVLAGLNIAFMPVLIGLICVGLMTHRRRKYRQKL